MTRSTHTEEHWKRREHWKQNAKKSAAYNEKVNTVGFKLSAMCWIDGYIELSMQKRGHCSVRSEDGERRTTRVVDASFIKETAVQRASQM